MMKRLAKYAAVFYIIQALVGIGVGAYFGVTATSVEMERIYRYVAH